ncbi:DUF6130 family protein [Variovorax saccharolyticus]|uniref:DUF6130 family protein n=1 Tax=Variovorax saccharolyticus TaxID=3053516 RepID=UPI002575A5AB|nr:DUF6130 family protein [Variovorax sp. J31P216]MDM0025231.1 DUF6130 family protein [Variovorax sp. J31P216]
MKLSLIAAAPLWAGLALVSAVAGAQTGATEVGRPAAVIPLASEPVAKLVV